eukprot:55444-Amphidinium_carterae.1
MRTALFPRLCSKPFLQNRSGLINRHSCGVGEVLYVSLSQLPSFEGNKLVFLSRGVPARAST